MIASAGAIAHDLWKNVLGRGTEEDERKVAPRSPSIGVGVAAILGTLAIGSGFNVTVLVSMAFVFAASANFPPLLLALLWRRFNTTGALTGIAVRHHRLGDHDRAQPAGVAGPGLAGLAVVADVPGPRDDPDRLPRLLARHDAQPREETAPSAATTSCSCARRPASAPRAGRSRDPRGRFERSRGARRRCRS